MLAGSANRFQRTYQKYYKIFQSHWLPYVEANNYYADSEMLVAYHTLETARQAEKAADYSLLAVYFVKESLNDKTRRM